MATEADFFGGKQKIDNGAENGHVCNIENRERVAEKDEVEHINDMSMNKIVDDIACCTCGNQSEWNTQPFSGLKECDIHNDCCSNQHPHH